MKYPLKIKLSIRGEDEEDGHNLGFILENPEHMHQVDRLFNGLIRSAKVIIREAKL